MSNPLSDLIAHGESNAAGYNAYNRGTYRDADHKQLVRGPNGAIDFSTLTLGQVHDRQLLGSEDPDRLFAVGKYQIIPTTLGSAIDRLHLDRDQPFTPALQERIFSDYLIVDKRPDVHDYITDKPCATLEAAQRGMAQEWASFGDPDNGGHSHYPPPNKASITLAQSSDALDQMRTDYQADIARGLSPEEAWKAVTDATPSREQATPHLASHAHGTENLLREGTHGQTVHDLQANLAHLGYTDHHHKPLAADGHFGIDTRHAVERFQHHHGLAVDGVAGPKTLEALHRQGLAKAAITTPHLDHPSHPDHTLYQQAREAVHRLIGSMAARRNSAAISSQPHWWCRPGTKACTGSTRPCSVRAPPAPSPYRASSIRRCGSTPMWRRSRRSIPSSPRAAKPGSWRHSASSRRLRRHCRSKHSLQAARSTPCKQFRIRPCPGSAI